jgi:cation:H+ antiporter
MSSLKGYNDAAFGNIIGSNNFNLLMILGVAGIIYPLVVQRNTVKFEVPISIITLLILYFLINDVAFKGSSTNVLSRLDAFILICCFGLFMLYIYHTMKNSSDFSDSVPIKIYSTPVSVAYIIIGMAMLLGGGHLVVENAVSIANYFDISEKIIGLTILAAGTSLPELATSAVAAYKKNTDIAIGNVVGSNIFNITFILGTSGLVKPLAYNTELNLDMYVTGVASLLLLIFMFTLNQRKLDRWEAILLFTGYITYTMYIIGRE